MYKLINKDNVNLLEPIKTIFKNRNIDDDDIAWFVKPTPFEYSPKLLGNIEKGVHSLLMHIKKSSHIHIQIDKDLDGFTSAAILVNYLKRAFPNIDLTWSNHLSEKKHGIDINLVPVTTKLLIIPDAGSNEYEIHKTLFDRGVEILILDHHEAPHYSEHAIVVNNQLDNSPNRWLSGAGVVYKFIQLLDEALDLRFSQDYCDLVAFGMIGDAMDLSSKETKWLITKGLSNIKNEFLSEIIKENVDADAKLTSTVIAFKCNPKINAYLRVGSTTDLDDLFKALIGHQEVTINSRLRKADKSETWSRRITRICNNMYVKQQKLRTAAMDELSEKIEREKLYENTFIIIEAENNFETNMSGYIASFLVSKYRKPTLLVRNKSSDDDRLYGSMRGYDELMKDTKDFLQGLNLFDYVEGHQNAAGLRISRENFKLLDAKINEAFQNLVIEKAHSVDLIMPAKMIVSKLVAELENYSHIWGKGIEPPSIAAENLVVDLGDAVIMGKNGDMIKFLYNDISYVKFNNAGELIALKEKKKRVRLNVVGRTSLNTWKGTTEAQFVIDAFEVVEIMDKPKFTF